MDRVLGAALLASLVDPGIGVEADPQPVETAPDEPGLGEGEPSMTTQGARGSGVPDDPSLSHHEPIMAEL